MGTRTEPRWVSGDKLKHIIDFTEILKWKQRRQNGDGLLREWRSSFWSLQSGYGCHEYVTRRNALCQSNTTQPVERAKDAMLGRAREVVQGILRRNEAADRVRQASSVAEQAQYRLQEVRNMSRVVMCWRYWRYYGYPVRKAWRVSRGIWKWRLNRMKKMYNVRSLLDGNFRVSLVLLPALYSSVRQQLKPLRK